MNTKALLFLGFGVFIAACAIFDVEWFMAHRKARLFVGMFGRNGARVVYGIIGVAIIVAALIVGSR